MDDERERQREMNKKKKGLIKEGREMGREIGREMIWRSGGGGASV